MRPGLVSMVSGAYAGFSEGGGGAGGGGCRDLPKKLTIRARLS